MNKGRVIALIVHLGGVAFAWILIHFLFTFLAGRGFGSASYFILIAFLFLWGAWKGFQIVIGKDGTAMQFEKWHRNNHL